MNQANRKAFLDMLAHSEIGPRLLALSDDGYNVIVGSYATAKSTKLILMNSYADHPRKLIPFPNLKNPTTGKMGIYSSAAGRYQITKKNFDAYRKLLKLKDFGKAAQDAIALQMIKEQGALADVDAGRIPQAIAKCRNIWASLPGAGYGQPENSLPALLAAYAKAGGTRADSIIKAA